jgi:transposase-like protein
MAAPDGTVERRRTRSLDDRKRIVVEALAPGASVAAVARRHGLNANLIFQVDTALARGVARSAARACEGEACRGRSTGEGRIGLCPDEAA